MCGLKHLVFRGWLRRSVVTPCVGVWIETSHSIHILPFFLVTPCVGVWIETKYIRIRSYGSQGHTLRGCVDWNNFNPYTKITITCHTLRGCVDWNKVTNVQQCCIAGHTLRGCVDWNLVQYNVCACVYSHTLRGCVDWNITSKVLLLREKVTPCVGVWIETWKVAERNSIKHRHTLRGCVDWNGKPAEALYYFMGHTLRGCVDWNWKHTVRFSTILVTPCVGVWIETAMRKKYAKKQLSHPAWVCGLKRWNTWS